MTIGQRQYIRPLAASTPQIEFDSIAPQHHTVSHFLTDRLAYQARRKLMLQLTARFTSFLVITCFLTTAAMAFPQQAQKPITNDDVVKMVKGGLPEDTIVSAIQASATHFDISADALISLKNAGVTQPVMGAMIAAESNKRTAVSQASTGAPGGTAAALSGHFQVELLPAAPAPGADASQVTLPMTAEKTQLAETKTKTSSLGGLAGDSALNQGLKSGVNTAIWQGMSQTSSAVGGIGGMEAGSIVGGMMTSHHSSNLTYVWAVPGANSSNVSVPSHGANFRVTFAGASGVNPDDYEPVIVKLISTPNNWRLVGATQGKQNARSTSGLDWQMYSAFLENRVPTQSQKLGPGEYQIAPTGNLAPGEYGVVLRPLSKTKKFSGSDVAGNLGDGLIFNSIWSFEIR
jgi:hypothetical protein